MKEYCYLTVRYYSEEGQLLGEGNTSSSVRGAEWLLNDHVRKFNKIGMTVEVLAEHYMDHPHMPSFEKAS